MGACTEIDASTCIRSYELHEPRNIPHLANFIIIPDSTESSSLAVLRLTIDPNRVVIEGNLRRHRFECLRFE